MAKQPVVTNRDMIRYLIKKMDLSRIRGSGTLCLIKKAGEPRFQGTEAESWAGDSPGPS